MMGRQKKQGNQFPHSKKLVQEPEGNEENRYSDPDSNKMKINYAKEPNEAHKINRKEEILQVINENLLNNSRPVKRKCKNSLTPSKDQT
jgi:hypothetical protein